MRHVLTDEVFYYGSTQDCLRVRTDDGQRRSFALSDGSESRCEAPLGWRPHISHTVENGIISMLRRGARAERDGVSYRLTTRRPGTAFLVVSADQRGRELWNVPLRFVPVGGEAIGTLAIVATPGVVVAFGVARGSSDQGITAVGLNADGGTERFATNLPAFIASIDDVHYNERYVIARVLSRLDAIDPTTGTVAWSLGR